MEGQWYVHGVEYQALVPSVSFKTASFRLIKINPRPFLFLLYGIIWYTHPLHFWVNTHTHNQPVRFATSTVGPSIMEPIRDRVGTGLGRPINSECVSMDGGTDRLIPPPPTLVICITFLRQCWHTGRLGFPVMTVLRTCLVILESSLWIS